MAQRTESVFVYGTLLDSKIRRSVLGRNIDGIDDVLEGFAISNIVLDGGTYPIAVSNPNSSIQGKILELSPRELSRLDGYETSIYRRKKIVLKSGEMAWVYHK